MKDGKGNDERRVKEQGKVGRDPGFLGNSLPASFTDSQSALPSDERVESQRMQLSQRCGGGRRVFRKRIGD